MRMSEEGLAWLGLALTDGLSPRHAADLVTRYGSPSAVLHAPRRLLEADGVTPPVAEELGRAVGKAEVEAARLAASSATLVTLADAHYPHRLRSITDPPLVLAIRGRLGAEDLAVAVVGARRASEYGRRVAAELAAGLAQAGLVVVSGLAAGVDAAAHRGALAAGGETVAVLGTGIDVVYPAWHRDLAREIADAGALVTEFACGTPALPYNFPRRNRIISGLVAGVVVVEAAEQSGSLITARCALEQGREVFAVPGPLARAEHRGPHLLIQQGAKLVTGVEDILDELAPALIARVAHARAAAAEGTLSTVERQVLDAVGGDGGHVDEVIRRAEMAAGPALETLLALELRGLVEQIPGKRFRRRAA
jgi:DNA processing protein